MASFEGVLAGIPGYGGYLAKDQLNRRNTLSDLQQVQGVQGLLAQVQAQQRAQQVQGVLSDPSIPAEQKRMALVGLMRDPTQAANAMHQMETEKANADLRRAQAETQGRLLEAERRRTAQDARVQGASDQLSSLLSPQVSERDGAQRIPFVGTEAQLIEQMKKAPGVYSLVNPAQVRGLQAIIDPKEMAKGLLSTGKQDAPYTLGPGAMRLDANGNVIAQAPFAPRVEPTQQIVQTPSGPALLPRGSDTLSPLKNADGSTTAPAKPVESPMQKATFNAGLKEVAADEKAASAASNIENAIKRWQELNAKVSTGPVAGRRPISFDSDYQELKQLEDFLAVNNFKSGQGQISNFERTLIKGAGPKTSNNREANENIVKIMLGGVQNMRDKAQFKEWYLEQNKKTLGADKAWQDYINKNPRFSRDDNGNIVENQERVDWTSHFRSAPSAPASGEWSVVR